MVATHKKKISEMDGIGRTMPVTMLAFTLGSLSIIGIPPMGGAASKWFLGLGAIEAHQLVFAGAYMLSSLLSIGYLMPVVARAFFCKPKPSAHGHGDDDHHGDDHHGHDGDGIHEAPMLCVVPLSITAIGTIVLFFFASELHALLVPITGGGG